MIRNKNSAMDRMTLTVTDFTTRFPPFLSCIRKNMPDPRLAIIAINKSTIKILKMKGVNIISSLCIIDLLVYSNCLIIC